MAKVDIDWDGMEKQVVALAGQIFGAYEKQALQDFRTFRTQIEKDLVEWLIAVGSKEIDIDELKSLIEGEKDLLILHALKQKGLAFSSLDKFTEGVMNIVINSATSAIKII